MKLPTIPAIFSSRAPGTFDLSILVSTAILSFKATSEVVFPPWVGGVDPEPEEGFDDEESGDLMASEEEPAEGAD